MMAKILCFRDSFSEKAGFGAIGRILEAPEIEESPAWVD